MTEIRKLAVLQSMWAMGHGEPTGAGQSVAESISMIVNAGYDGISAVCSTWEVVKETARATAGQRLVIEALKTIRSPRELQTAIEMAEYLGAHHLNIQADVRPGSMSDALEFAEQCLKIGEAASLPIFYETHRDRLTNDPLITLEILDRFPAFNLLADLSHYVVSREFAWPITPETDEFIHRILDRSWAFHGRVASQHQVQVEISYSQHRAWFDQFLLWWGYGMRSWLERAQKGATLCFTCELGPRPYAITDKNGEDTTDRWSEAKLLKAEVRRVWERVVASQGCPHVTD
jgi:hypothetical protein